MERQGASHRITQSRPGETPQPGVRKTRLMRGWDTKGWNLQSHELGSLAGRRSDEHFDMSTWSGPAGHSAEVEERHGDRSWVAGPYRTQYRSQVAAESLTERARVDNADRYQRRH